MSVFTVRVKFSGQVEEDVETYGTRPAAARAAAGLAGSAFRDGRRPVSVGIHVTALDLGCGNEHCAMFKTSTSLSVCRVCHRATAPAVYEPREKTWRRRPPRQSTPNAEWTGGAPI
jgi:hypothetical protein